MYTYEKKTLEALYNVATILSSLNINVDNTGVINAIQNIDNADVVQAIQNISIDNSSVVAAIQGLTYPTILAKQDSGLTKLDSAISKLDSSLTKLDTLNTSLATLISAVNAKSPILKSSVATFREILSANIPGATSVRLMAANSNRIGYAITNNSTNSLYVGPTNPPSGAKQFFQLATNAGPTCMIQCFGPTVWTGELWCYRNSGTGGVTGYEFEA